MSSSNSSSGSYNSPCAACKFLRRKCMPGCIFAPYFPPEEPHKFANVHKIFGASNVAKLLNDLHPHQRHDAVHSLAYEAEARVRDPVYGCVAAISYLQRQVQSLQKELDVANADLMRYACGEITHQGCFPPNPMPLQRSASVDPYGSNDDGSGVGGEGGGGGNWVYPPPSPPYSLPYPSTHPWNTDNERSGGGGGQSNT